MATKATKKPVKKPAKKPAAPSVKRIPATTPAPEQAPKIWPKEMAILCLKFLSADATYTRSLTLSVDAAISKDEIAAIAQKKAQGGTLLESHLIPYSPGI